MKTKIVLSLIVGVIASLNVFAGHEGNGGDVVVCMQDRESYQELRNNLIDNFKNPVELKQDPFRDNLISKIKKPIRMLDINRSSSIRNFEGSWKDEYLRMLDKFDSWGNLNDILLDFDSKTEWVESSSGVLEISDSNHKSIMQENCLVVQMAYQEWISSSYQQVEYDVRLWELMEKEDRLALRLHEAIANIERKRLSRSNTTKTRLTVAWLMSEKFETATLNDFVSYQKKLGFLTEHIKTGMCVFEDSHFNNINKTLRTCKDSYDTHHFVEKNDEIFIFKDKHWENEFSAKIDRIFSKSRRPRFALKNLKIFGLQVSEGTFSTEEKILESFSGLNEPNIVFNNLKLSFPLGVSFDRKAVLEKQRRNARYYDFYVQFNLNQSNPSYFLNSNIEIRKSLDEKLDDEGDMHLIKLGNGNYVAESIGKGIEYVIHGYGANSFVCQSIKINKKSKLESCELVKGQNGRDLNLPSGFADVEIKRVKFDSEMGIYSILPIAEQVDFQHENIRCRIGHRPKAIKLHENGRIRSCDYSSGQEFLLGGAMWPVMSYFRFYDNGQLEKIDLSDYTTKALKIDGVKCEDSDIYVHTNGRLWSCRLKNRMRFKINSSNLIIEAEEGFPIKFHFNQSVRVIYARKSFKYEGKKYPAYEVYEFDQNGKMLK